MKLYASEASSKFKVAHYQFWQQRLFPPQHAKGVQFSRLLQHLSAAGNPNSDMRSYTKIDDHTLGFNVKKGGKVTTSGRVVVSADGKSRTVTTSRTDPQGKKFKSTAVYDKQ